VPANAAVTGSESPLHDLASFTREEVLRLVQRLFLAADNVGNTALRKVVFCGIDETDGSNRLCARVGRVLAELVQSQVCVVDANVRTSSSSPLADLLPFDDSRQSKCTSTNGLSRRVTSNLWLASGDSSGTNGASPTLGDVQARISGLPAEFEHVIISAPPVGFYTDAALLGQAADGVVLVLEANSTRRLTALKAKRALESVNVRVLGTVLNNRSFPIPEEIYRRL